MKRVIASLFVAVPLLMSGCNAGPMEEEIAPEVVTEVGQIDQNVVTNLVGSGTLLDNSSGKITYSVVEIADTSKAVFVLRTASNITWWKSLDLFHVNNGNYYSIRRIETKDSVHEAQMEYFSSESANTFLLEFWKAGFLGAGAKAHAIEMNNWHAMGKKFTFTWVRD